MSDTKQQAGADWSIVLAYYNEADFLPDTLQSLAAQKMRGFRLILVDNASKDDTVAMIRREFPDVQIIAMSSGGPNGRAVLYDAASQFGVLVIEKPFGRSELVDIVQESLASV